MQKISRCLKTFTYSTLIKSLLKNYKYYSQIQSTKGISKLKRIFSRSKLIYKVIYKPFTNLSQHCADTDRRFYFLLTQKKILKYFGGLNSGRTLHHMKIQRYFVNLMETYFSLKEEKKSWSLVNGIKSSETVTISLDYIFKFLADTFDATYTLVECQASERNFKRLKMFLEKARKLREINITGNVLDEDFLRVFKLVQTFEPLLGPKTKIHYKVIKDINSKLNNQVVIGENIYGQQLKFTFSANFVQILEESGPSAIEFNIKELENKNQIQYMFQNVSKLSLNFAEKLQLTNTKFSKLPSKIKHLELCFHLKLFRSEDQKTSDFTFMQEINLSSLTQLETLQVSVINIEFFEEYIPKIFSFLQNIPPVNDLSIMISFNPFKLSLAHFVKILRKSNTSNLKKLQLGFNIELSDMKPEDFNIFEKLQSLKITGDVNPKYKLENIFTKMKNSDSVTFYNLRLGLKDLEGFLEMFNEQLKTKKLSMKVEIIGDSKDCVIKSFCNLLKQAKYIPELELEIKVSGVKIGLSENDRAMIKKSLEHKLKINRLKFVLGKNSSISFVKQNMEYIEVK